METGTHISIPLKYDLLLNQEIVLLNEIKKFSKNELIKYISNEIIRCLTKDYNYIDKEIHVNFQNHSKKVGFAYTKDEFYQVSNLIHNDSNVNFQLNQ